MFQLVFVEWSASNDALAVCARAEQTEQNSETATQPMVDKSEVQPAVHGSIKVTQPVGNNYYGSSSSLGEDQKIPDTPPAHHGKTDIPRSCILFSIGMFMCHRCVSVPGLSNLSVLDQNMCIISVCFGTSE